MVPYHPRWGRLLRRASRMGDVFFDLRRGTTTWRRVSRAAVAAEVGRDPQDLKPYHCIPQRTFKRIMAALPVAPTGFTFVDIGCGKGKALVMAQDAGFEAVVGVEISPALAQVAEVNLQRIQAAQASGQVVCMDACDYEFIPGNKVVFLYNPFGSRSLAFVLYRLAAQVADHMGDEVYVVYLNPRHNEVFADYPEAELLMRGQHWDPNRCFNLYRLHPEKLAHEDLGVDLGFDIGHQGR